MAITRTVTPGVVQHVIRTKRAVLQTPASGAYEIIVTREIIGLNAQGEVMTREDGKVIRRLAADVLAEVTTLNSGKTLTNAEIIEAMQKTFDRWDIEDDA